MLSGYDSVFNHSGPIEVDDEWYNDDIPLLSMEELIKEYHYYEEYLWKLRSEEPARKRSRKTEYEIWVKRTQQIENRLNKLAMGFQARKEKHD